MAKKNFNGYERASFLESDINELNDSIDNIGSDNIINHSRVADIENDIKRIEGNIKITKRQNVGKSCIRNVKIFGRALQGIFPYVVVAGLVFGGFCMFGEVPFYPQPQFKVAQHEQVLDNSGVVNDNVTYVLPSSSTTNSAHFSTKWEKKEDGKYYRMIKEYNIGSYTTEQLKELIKNPDLDFEETFGKSTSIKYEVKDEKQITKEDLEEGTGFKIVYRYTDEEDVVLKAQDVWPNIGFSLLYIVLTFLPSLLVVIWRSDESDFDFKDYVDDYCDEYKGVNLKELERLFKEKKIKFEKVRHQQVSMVDPITEGKMLIKTKKTI